MCHTIKIKSGKSLLVSIKSADSPEDVAGLTEINNRWQKELLGNDSSRGFLSAAFFYDIFKLLVDSNEVIVATYNNRVIGYYLVNSTSVNGVLYKHRKIVDYLKKRSIIRAVNVGLGSQSLVDKDFQGTSLRKLMLLFSAKIFKIGFLTARSSTLFRYWSAKRSFFCFSVIGGKVNKPDSIFCRHEFTQLFNR